MCLWIVDPEVPCSSQGGGTIPQSVLRLDRHCLPQRAILAVVDEDAVVLGHDGKPVRPLGHGGGARARRHRDAVGQGQRTRLVAPEAGDKEADHHYEADNHRGGQERDQPRQKLQCGRGDRRRVVIHGIGPACFPDRG